jgi:putative membrane protein
VIGLHTRVSEWLGLGLLQVGALIIVGATQRFYRNRRAIEVADSSPYGDSWIARVMSGLLKAISSLATASDSRRKREEQQ